VGVAACIGGWSGAACGEVDGGVNEEGSERTTSWNAAREELTAVLAPGCDHAVQ